MNNIPISDGVAHKVPNDLKDALLRSKESLKAWESLTPIARNEWICWSISVKQQATRQNHIKRTVTELKEGKRRPCCWMGCVHRADKAISPSVQWALSKQKPKVKV
ncbi:MAG TPA: YdeI/OmpD-associated family protein [Candidatus Saccharimonadales bacterium]|nr:YdeI/OmpD-associated family protein [Candidatus Saccharimonadales bacterium]